MGGLLSAKVNTTKFRPVQGGSRPVIIACCPIALGKGLTSKGLMYKEPTSKGLTIGALCFLKRLVAHASS